MINDIFVYIAFASIAGGITSATFLIFEKWIYKMTSASYMVFLNGFSIMTFLLPYYVFYFRAEGENSVFGVGRIAVITHSEISETFYSFLNRVNVGRIISIIWIIGMVLYLVISIFIYIRLIKKIEGSAFPIENSMWNGAFDEIRKKGRDKADMRLIFSDIFTQPFTTGIIKRYIVIPMSLESSLSKEEIWLMLKHEITHIRRNDVPFKIFIEVLNCIHWFNPLFYFMKYRLDMWIEMGCDEKLNEGFTEEARNSYIDLLVKMFEINAEEKREHASFFASRKTKNFKRRLYAIMKRKGKGNMVAKVAVSCMAVCVFIGSSYVAKAADYSVYGVFGEKKEVINEKDFTKITDEEMADELNDYLNYRSIDDIEIIGSDNEDVEPYHNHEYVDIKVTKHKKYSDGSCDIIYYNAQECTICGKCLVGNKYKTVHFEKCPH